MGRKPAKMIGKPAKNRRWTSSRQDPPGDEQKLDTRPTTPGDWAADQEAEPEERAEVDQALGRGQITCSSNRWQRRPNERPLFGEVFILCLLVELARTRGEAWQHVFAIEVVSRGHSSESPMPTATRRPERQKTRNEPSMNSEQPNETSRQLRMFEDGDTSQDIQRDDWAEACIEKSALNEDHALMEEIVDDIIIEMAWARVRTNRGAPGPDGITVKEFPEWIRPRWETIRGQLLDGTYRPSPARRVSIEKPDGGTRELGIPNLLDRVIQTAIVRVLTPIFDPEFSESSFGYRPHRSAQGAVKQVQTIIRGGRRWCVDMDLSKFFDRVQHDVLMSRVSRKVHDKRLLKLIGRYLRAGVMVGGLCQPSEEGTMQGGPLSPLLSNIYLDALDKELEKRGLPFVRYADDFAIFTKSEAAAQRVYASVERFLRERLKLAVNHDKSSIRQTDGLEYVGYEFRGYGGQIRVSQKKLDAFKQRASEIFRKSRGVSMKSRLSEFRSYAMGWIGYFALDQVRTTFVTLDKWLRRRVRACYWKQWRKAKTRLKKLTSLSVSARVARGFALSGKGAWRLSMTSGVQRALSIEYLTAEGLLNLEERWKSFASLRRTA